MSHRPFSEPLLLALPTLGTFVADSVWELDEYLNIFWPQDDPDLPALKRLCEDALDGWVTPETVRSRALQLAKRQGILVSTRASVYYRAIQNYWPSEGSAA